MAYSGTGAGTEIDPYIVTTPSQLNEVRSYRTSFFKLGNDIDLNVSPYNSGSGWLPICDQPGVNFTGGFDGAGYTINNLYINRNTTDFVGLFGYILASSSNNTFRRLKITNAYVKGKDVCGILAGKIENCKINNIHTDGEVIAEGTGAGGFAGWIELADVARCSSKADVSSVGNVCAGFTPYIGYSGAFTIRDCFTRSNLLSNGAGFININSSPTSLIRNCYSASTIISGNGFVSTNSNTENCFFDKDLLTTNSSSSWSEAKTTEEMKTKSTFKDYPFDVIWDYTEDAYPELLEPDFYFYIDEFEDVATAPNINNFDFNTKLYDADGNYTTYTRRGLVYSIISRDYPGSVLPENSDYEDYEDSISVTEREFENTIDFLREYYTYFVRAFWVIDSSNIIYSREIEVTTNKKDKTILFNNKYDEKGELLSSSLRIKFE